MYLKFATGLNNVHIVIHILLFQAWEPPLNFLRNNSVLDWLEEIRNLSLEASNKSTAAADNITNFLQNIHHTSHPSSVFRLQTQLIQALDEIHFILKCKSEKEHAIVVAITKCRDGSDEFDNLFTLVSSTLQLNHNKCISNNLIPHTSRSQLQIIIQDMAQKTSG